MNGLTDKLNEALKFSVGFDNEQIKSSYYSRALKSSVTIQYI